MMNAPKPWPLSKRILSGLACPSRWWRRWRVSRFVTRTRLPLRLLAGMFGVLLLTYLVWRAGPAKLLAGMVALGWGLSLIIALGGVSHLVKTWAWRLTLLDDKHQVSFARMLGLRLGAAAVGQ